MSLQEDELRALRREEAERAKILMDLGSQRDRVALSIAQKLAKVGVGGGRHLLPKCTWRHGGVEKEVVPPASMGYIFPLHPITLKTLETLQTRALKPMDCASQQALQLTPLALCGVRRSKRCSWQRASRRWSWQSSRRSDR